LPLLEAMTVRPSPAQVPEAPLRFMTWFRPGGAVPEQWTVTGDETSFQLSPTLAPLAPFQDRLLLLEGLDYTVNVKSAGHP
jgi:hypothetical protein